MKVQEKHDVTFCLCVNLIFIVKREEMNELCFIFLCSNFFNLCQMLVSLVNDFHTMSSQLVSQVSWCYTYYYIFCYYNCCLLVYLISCWSFCSIVHQPYRYPLGRVDYMNQSILLADFFIKTEFSVILSV